MNAIANIAPAAAIPARPVVWNDELIEHVLDLATEAATYAPQRERADWARLADECLAMLASELDEDLIFARIDEYGEFRSWAGDEIRRALSPDVRWRRPRAPEVVS